MVYVNAMLAASFIVAAIGAQKDLRLWAGALVLHLTGYLALALRGVSEFLCKRFGLQLMEMRSPN